MGVADGVPRSSSSVADERTPNRRVICGVDGSHRATEAVAVAADLADRLEMQLILVHVSDEPLAFPYGDAALRERQRASALHSGDVLIDGILEQAGLSAATERHLACGEPAAVLRALVHDLAADLVVVASRGRGALRSTLFGSTSRELARDLACPLVVVPPGGADAYHRLARNRPATVVVGFDETGGCEATLSCADQLAAALGARLIVVGVASPVLPAPTFPMVPAPARFGEPYAGLKDAAQQQLEEACRQMEAAKDVEADLETGHLDVALTSAAERAGARLVVTATGGGLGEPSWQRVAAASARPVVVVPHRAAGALVPRHAGGTVKTA